MNKAIVVFGNVIEALIIYNYWIHSFERRFSKGITNTVYWGASAAIILQSYIFMDEKIVRAVLTHLILLTLIGILFKDKWPRKIMIYLLYFFCTFTAEVIALALSKYLFDYDLVLDGSVASFFWEIIDFFLIVLLNLIALLALKHRKLDLNSKTQQMTFLFLTVQALSAFFMLEVIYTPDLSFKRAFVIVAFTLTASLLADILIFRYLAQLTAEAARTYYLKAESELKDQHFREMRKQYEAFRRMEHDFLNHIRVIEATLNIEKKGEYIRELRENLETVDRASFCDSPALDALLYIKNKEAQNRGIDLRMMICDCLRLTVTDYDLCTIVSNLLDNAIEASAQTEGKWIELQMTRKAGRLLLKVVNASNPVDPVMQTKKADRSRHGIGLESIKETAKKYDGDTLFRYKDGEFESIVNLEE